MLLSMAMVECRAVSSATGPRNEKTSPSRLTPFAIIMVTRLTCIAAVLEEPNSYYQIPPLSNVTILLSRHVFFPLPSILL
jgi:hypothetical protein